MFDYAPLRSLRHFRFSSATIESLRARLLAERASSKEAREQTQEIAAKVFSILSTLAS